jgi:hypothetical protein
MEGAIPMSKSALLKLPPCGTPVVILWTLVLPAREITFCSLLIEQVAAQIGSSENS